MYFSNIRERNHITYSQPTLLEVPPEGGAAGGWHPYSFVLFWHTGLFSLPIGLIKWICRVYYLKHGNNATLWNEIASNHNFLYCTEIHCELPGQVFCFNDSSQRWIIQFSFSKIQNKKYPILTDYFCNEKWFIT